MWIQNFIDYLRYERNLSERTVSEYQADLEAFERFYVALDENYDWQSVDGSVVREWMLHMMENGQRASSVSRRLSALRTFYKFLLQRGLTDHDPVHSVSSPKKERALPTYLREAELNRLLDGTDIFPEGYVGVRDRMIILMFYSTGIRRAELVGMNLQDVDVHLRQIKVTGKRNKQRLIPYGAEMEADLHLYCEARKAFCKQHSECDALFLDERTGERIEAPKVWRIVHKYLTLVTTQKKRSPHVLRHTFATSLLNHHADLQSVKELLGHESLSTTEIYTHTSFEELKELYKQAHPRATEKGGNYGH